MTPALLPFDIPQRLPRLAQVRETLLFLSMLPVFATNGFTKWKLVVNRLRNDSLRSCRLYLCSRELAVAVTPCFRRWLANGDPAKFSPRFLID